MPPGRWEQIEQIFDATLAQPEAEKRAFVDRACARDPELQAEVESLLASAADATRELRGVVARGARRMAMDATSKQIGRRLGAYRLDTLLGEGGMGAVYLASRDDTEYDRRVASRSRSFGRACRPRTPSRDFATSGRSSRLSIIPASFGCSTAVAPTRACRTS
jgi:hypothetical protein